jgi:hypothetical protein
MALSEKVNEEVLEAKSHLRNAIKNAAVNEKPLVIQQLSKVLLQLEEIERFEELMDLLDSRKPGSSGSFGSSFG